MSEKLNEYVDGVFAPYDGAKSVGELKADLLTDLHERYRDLVAEGKDEATALELTIDSIGDIEETVREVSSLSRTLERQVVTRFDASDLKESDFAGVVVRDAKFNASALRGSDFSNADLTGGSFKYSDLADANFAGANLTDATLSTSELVRTDFRRAVLVRTEFSMSGLADTQFADSVLTDVKFRMTDLRRTTFQRCSFVGVDFSMSDLRDQDFAGMMFTSVNFEKAGLEGVSFRGATLRDVSFRATSRKFVKALRTVIFDGARMDKLTYAGLKGLGIDLAGVIVE